jgi:GST-like protein
MTETAAIALMILDQRPDLAPAPGTPQRPQFQRLLVWLVANVYPTFTYADYPERWAPAARSSWWRIVASTGKISISGSNSTGRRAVGAGRVGNVAGLLYRGDVPLGTPPGVV